MWREEPAEVKKSYEALAETAKAEHALKYPGMVVSFYPQFYYSH